MPLEEEQVSDEKREQAQEELPLEESSASEEGQGISDESQQVQETPAQQEEPPPETPKEEEPDWKQIAMKERHKRQLKARENEKLKEQIDSKAREFASAETPRPRRPRLYDEEIGGDEEKFEAAMDKYEDESYAYRERQSEARRQRQEVSKKVDSYQDRLSAYASENPDYEKAWMEAGKPALPSHVEQALMESDIGPQIEHHLFANLDDLNAVTNSSPISAIREVCRIEASLSEKAKSKGDSEIPKSRKTSGAPPPIATETGGSAKSAGNASLPSGYHYA